MKFRKINVDEFNNLKRLSPESTNWEKYKNRQIERFKNNEIDIYIVENDDKFIGELTINYINHDLKTETIPNVRVYLEAFRIDKEYKGKGLGQELIQYAISDLSQNGYSEFTIGVEEDNEIAKHIYFKLGFTKAIDKGLGNEFDSCEYTLYLRKT